MKVEQLMTRDVETCGFDETLERAAQRMWERDCGAVPVIAGADGANGVLQPQLEAHQRHSGEHATIDPIQSRSPVIIRDGWLTMSDKFDIVSDELYIGADDVLPSRRPLP